MTVAEMMEIVGFSVIDVFMVTPLGGLRCRFDTDHISEDENMFYLENAEGYPFELKKDSEVILEDGEYSLKNSDCLICIKLSE